MSTFPQHLGWDHRPSICNNGNGTTEHSGGPMACAVLLKHATTTHNWSENCIQSLKVCVNTPAPFPRKDPCFFRQDWCQKENYTPLTDERWRKPLYHALLILLVFRAVFRAASNPRTYPNAPFHVLFRHSSYWSFASLRWQALSSQPSTFCLHGAQPTSQLGCPFLLLQDSSSCSSIGSWGRERPSKRPSTTNY